MFILQCRLLVPEQPEGSKLHRARKKQKHSFVLNCFKSRKYSIIFRATTKKKDKRM